MIRFNPDPFTADGRRHNILWSQRMELLLEAINTNAWGVSYICYDNALKFTVPLAVIMILALAIRLSVGPIPVVTRSSKSSKNVGKRSL